MNKIIKKFLKDEKGQALPFFALLVVVLFGFVALAFDLGFTTYSKSELQLSADAAALAAALDIPPVRIDGTYPNPTTVDAKIITTGKKFARMQWIKPDPDPLGVDVDPDVVNSKVTVTLTKTVEHFFAKIINVPSTTITATAVAHRYAVWDGSVLPLINMNEEYWNDTTNTGGTIDIREKIDGTSSDRDWVYIQKYMQNEGITNIEDLRLDPLEPFKISHPDGLLVTKGGTQNYMNSYVKELLKYPGPYYVFSISQEVLSGLGTSNTNPGSGIGVYTVKEQGTGNVTTVPETRFLYKNGGYVPFTNADVVAPYVKLVGGKYVPCGKNDTGMVEQIKILKFENVTLSQGSGSNETLIGTVIKELSLDYEGDQESTIGITKSRLIE